MKQEDQHMESRAYIVLQSMKVGYRVVIFEMANVKEEEQVGHLVWLN